MHFQNVALAAGLAASAAARPAPGAPVPSTATVQSVEERATSPQQVVYWGQNNQERNLADYCTSAEGVNILVLAFIYEYGGLPIFGNFGEYCTTSGMTDQGSHVPENGLY